VEARVGAGENGGVARLASTAPEHRSARRRPLVWRERPAAVSGHLLREKAHAVGADGVNCDEDDARGVSRGASDGNSAKRKSDAGAAHKRKGSLILSDSRVARSLVMRLEKQLQAEIALRGRTLRRQG